MGRQGRHPVIRAASHRGATSPPPHHIIVQRPDHLGNKARGDDEITVRVILPTSVPRCAPMSPMCPIVCSWRRIPSTGVRAADTPRGCEQCEQTVACDPALLDNPSVTSDDRWQSAAGGIRPSALLAQTRHDQHQARPKPDALAAREGIELTDGNPIDAQEILSQDGHLIHSFANLWDLKQDGGTTLITRAKGAYVYDWSGNEYLDGIGGLWCVNVGHGRDEIIDAVTAQMRQLDYYSTFYNLTHPAAARLAAKVAALAPGDLNRVYFSNSGSVANDTAVRILHHYFNRLGKPRKKKILSRIGAYHGSTHLAIAMTTPAWRENWDSAADLVHHLACPHAYRESDGMSEAEFQDHLLDDMTGSIERIGAENIACFIAEPIMGAGGVIVPPAGYHQRTAEICRKYEIKYISDEVVTAFGRLGRMFASRDVFGIQPDIITTAKGLTSGYQPLAATIVSDEIFDVISARDAMFLHGMTYSGHPACAAAGLANIAILETDGIPRQVQTTGALFEKGLKSLEALDIVGEVRGSHFMIGIEFVRDKETREVFDDAAMIGKLVAREAQERGLIVRPLGNMAVLSPPLILDAAQIDGIVDRLRDSINAAGAALPG